VILPPAAALVRFLGLSGECVVIDVGAGTGALLEAIRSSAPAAHVVSLDASAGMLRIARTRRGAQAVLADALALPLGEGTADAAVLAYVLFHLADPSLAVAEAARVLRPDGRIGTITWARERPSRAEAMWDQALTEAGVPPAPPRRVDAGLDRADAVSTLLRSAGLRPERIWLKRLRHQWDSATFWELATGSGANQLRLSHVDAATGVGVLARAQSDLSRLTPKDFLWEGEIICAIATKVLSSASRTRPSMNGGGRR
jgi:SAM-dependent methyltransferase